MLYFKTFELSPHQDWVVFIHGAGGSSSIWYKQIKEYKKFYNILLLDLRGHGKSKDHIKSPHPYTFNEVSHDVIEVLDHLKINAAHFIGISLGTIVIRNIVELVPGRVKSMILGGAVLRLNSRVKTLMFLGNISKKIIPYMWLYKLFAWCLMPRKKHEISRLLFVEQAKKLCQKEFIRWFKLTKDTAPLLLEFERNPVDVPTIYIMGNEDYMFLLPVEESVKRSKNASLAIIDDSGHVCNVDQPQAFNRISLEFLQCQKSHPMLASQSQ
ncbi:alpha/beta hydrolase [Peribacillus saganii]|uniref:Alpha/beta hydrolase n=1 Tax=Peribacillus saganii TaxID=2303992 RepID=A0A372LVA7_9BACI|nr:alpha/beta hydrolase [Peribacillus saganii]RFU71504.1 alpha/beta hydrolase [Peribacillus saganii]